MPYTESNLPDHVKKLSAKKRRQWLHVYNSAVARGYDHGRAIRMANGVVGRKAMADISDKPWSQVDKSKLPKSCFLWVEGDNKEDWHLPVYEGAGPIEDGMYTKRGPLNRAAVRAALQAVGGARTGKKMNPPREVIDKLHRLARQAEIETEKDLVEVCQHQLAQGLVDYKPLGFTSNKGCATCNWMVPPCSCVLLIGSISSTGLCNLYYEKPVTEREPVPVVIVEEEKGNFIDTIKGIVRDILHKKPPTFYLYKSSDNWRFFAVYSNNFKDRDKEIITRAAHEEFAQWAARTGSYPDLYLWHCGKGSKWGTGDWIDCCDGFVCLSGLIDKEYEGRAEILSGVELRASHGFVPLLRSGKYILQYRSFEVSPLPTWAPANIWTGFNLKEVAMPFSAEKKKWLVDVAGVEEATVSEWESGLEDLSKNLKDLGIEWKESDVTGDIKQLYKAVSDLSVLCKQLSDAVTALRTAQAGVEAAVDAKVAAAISGSEVFLASQQNPPGDTAAKDIEWFKQLALGGLA